MTVPAIGAVSSAAAGFIPLAPQPVSAPTGATGTSSLAGAQGASSTDFGSLLGQGLEKLQGLQSHADSLAVQAATGNLSNLHDYTIAASEAQVATQLTAAVRNRALEAFNEIMRMSV
jgi:flagellar hook-basal body complex protein FliE